MAQSPTYTCVDDVCGINYTDKEFQPKHEAQWRKSRVTGVDYKLDNLFLFKHSVQRMNLYSSIVKLKQKNIVSMLDR